MAGGYTMSLPDEETLVMTREKFRAQLVALLGGRVAEEIRFGDVTTGASNDLERVTQLARSMVTQWGMSDKLGPFRYGTHEELVFLGRQFSEHRNYSDKVAQEIDDEIHTIVEEAHQRCRDLLLQHWDKMTLLANRPLQVETINASDLEALMRGVQPVEPLEKTPTLRTPVRESKLDDQSRADKRTDSGVDLGGTVPAPA
jgi:cell division protease FtsH